MLAETTEIEAKYDEARRRLRDGLQRVADEVKVLDPDRPEWRPLLDSRRIIGIVLVLEDLFSEKLAPDELIQEGGYNNVEEAIGDIIGRHKRTMASRAKTKKACT